MGRSSVLQDKCHRALELHNSVHVSNTVVYVLKNY